MLTGNDPHGIGQEHDLAYTQPFKQANAAARQL